MQNPIPVANNTSKTHPATIAVNRSSTQVCPRTIPSCILRQDPELRPQANEHSSVSLVNVNHATKNNRQSHDTALLPPDEDLTVSTLEANHNVIDSTTQCSKVRNRRRVTARTTDSAFASPNYFAVLNSQAMKKTSTRDYSVPHATSCSRKNHKNITKYPRQFNQRKGVPYCRSAPSRPAGIYQAVSVPPPRAVWSPPEAEAHHVTLKQPERASSTCGETCPPRSLDYAPCKGNVPGSAKNSPGGLRPKCTHPQSKVEPDTEKTDNDKLLELESSSNKSEKVDMNGSDINRHPDPAGKDLLRLNSDANFVTLQPSSHRTHTTPVSMSFRLSNDVHHSHATPATVSPCCTTTATLYNTDTCCFKVYLSDVFQSRHTWPNTLTLKRNGIVEL